MYINDKNAEQYYHELSDLRTELVKSDLMDKEDMIEWIDITLIHHYKDTGWANKTDIIEFIEIAKKELNAD